MDLPILQSHLLLSWLVVCSHHPLRVLLLRHLHLHLFCCHSLDVGSVALEVSLPQDQGTADLEVLTRWFCLLVVPRETRLSRLFRDEGAVLNRDRQETLVLRFLREVQEDMTLVGTLDFAMLALNYPQITS